jgi:hypothetical protein
VPTRAEESPAEVQGGSSDALYSETMGKHADGPIFVGGTGRSGTTILGRILGSHAELKMVPTEVRFIVDHGGLCDIISGKYRLDHFRDKLLGPWWYRTTPEGGTRGLHKYLQRSHLVDALRQLEASDLGASAAGEFIHRVLDPTVGAARRWVEMTPTNVNRGRQLLEILPEMKLIHIARDGRDVACSVAPLWWGPSDVFSAIDWWGDAMLKAHNACSGLGSQNLHEVRMEQLVGANRDTTIDTLFGFVGEAPDRAVRTFVEANVEGRHSRVGRWKSEVPPEQQPEFELRYERVLARLAEQGVPVSKWGFR